MSKSHEAGRNALILVHRRELVTQTSATLAKFGVSHGVIQPGAPAKPDELIQIAMVQTVVRRLDKIKTPDLIIVDEAHHAVSNTYKNIITACEKAVVVGFTATPIRLDGKGLRDYFGEIVLGPSVEWLMTEGHLVRPTYYAPPSMFSLAGVKTQCGDYAKDQLAEAMDKPKITGDVIGHYQRICNGSRAVVFCVNISHAQHVCSSFNEAGIEAGIIHGGLHRDDRRQIVDDLTTGKIRVMVSVDVISEGFDLPAVEVAILLRPTKSLGLFLQQIGRVLRPSEGKRAIILDHVGNLKMHGLAETERNWSLDGVKKMKVSEVTIHVKTCPACYCLHPLSLTCPECGFLYSVKPVKALESVAGELVEFREHVAPATLGECHSNADLKAYAKARGYKHGWVWHQMKALGRMKL